MKKMMTGAAETSRALSPNGERGMTMLVLLGIMAVFAVGLLAVAPSVYQEVQREKELEAIRRGEEIAEAIRQYVTFYQGRRLPNSMDDLLEGLPQGTKKRQILRASAAIDPLSEDGKWRLIKVDPQVLGRFAKRVQSFNNGLLPSNPQPQIFDRYGIVIVNAINTGDEDDTVDQDDDTDFEIETDNTPFIGVASQNKDKSVVAYYGIERHSSWIFTPLFRGNGGISPFQQNQRINRDRQDIQIVQ
jgi:type II secretory pathway pseudopilin PulG